MELVPLDYESGPVRVDRRLWWSFHITTAISFITSALALTAQLLHKGTLLIAGISAGTLDGKIQPEFFLIYGIVVGRYSANFPDIFAVTSILPVLWLAFMVSYCSLLYLRRRQ